MSIERRDWRDYLAIVLGVLATGVSLYLTIVHYRGDLLVCSTGGCETVQGSSYATIGPLPIALLGLVASVVMLLTAIVRLVRPAYAFYATVLLTAFAAIGVGYEVYLSYIEVAVLNAICQWCVSFATIITIWLLLELWRLYDEL